MARPRRLPDASLIARVFETPQVFEAFQAILHVQEWRRLEAREGGGIPDPSPLGEAKDPAKEALRFGAEVSLRFPYAELSRVREARGEEEPLEATLAVFGLFGPLGALPSHYTRLVIERVREKDHALESFLDLFNHHLCALWFRAWQKYHLQENAFSWTVGGDPADRALAGREETEPLRSALFAVQGFGARRDRDALGLRDEVLLFHTGLLQPHPRSAVGLCDLLSDAFRAPVEIEDFVGQWLELAPEDRSLMPTAARPEGQHARLGMDLVAGGRVWNAQSLFHVRIGPLSLARYRQFTPGERTLEILIALTKTWVGPGLDFGVRPVLAKEEIPPLRLGAAGEEAPRLGRTTWLQSRPAEADFDGVIFPVRTP